MPCGREAISREGTRAGQAASARMIANRSSHRCICSDKDGYLGAPAQYDV
jgi:hypothetical protein